MAKEGRGGCQQTAAPFVSIFSSFGKPLEPVFTTAERRLAGLFPVRPRRFPLQSVRIAAENLLA